MTDRDKRTVDSRDLSYCDKNSGRIRGRLVTASSKQHLCRCNDLDEAILPAVEAHGVARVYSPMPSLPPRDLRYDITSVDMSPSENDTDESTSPVIDYSNIEAEGHVHVDVGSSRRPSRRLRKEKGLFSSQSGMVAPTDVGVDDPLVSDDRDQVGSRSLYGRPPVDIPNTVSQVPATYICNENYQRLGYEQKAGRNYDWMLTRPVDGGPKDYCLLLGFGGHVAYSIWRNKERGILGCHQRINALGRWTVSQLISVDSQQFVRRSRLDHLEGCMFRHLNTPLLTAFVERWHPETNSFHLPFGEMTITLHDVQLILGIPSEGLPVESTSHRVETIAGIAATLGMPVDEVRAAWRAHGLKFSRIQQQCSGLLPNEQCRGRGFLIHLLGATLFVDKSRDCVGPGPFWAAIQDPIKCTGYSWGSATLAWLYRQLGIATRASCKQLAGCLTLLQAWIFLYFPIFAPPVNSDWDSSHPVVLKFNCSTPFPKSHKDVVIYRMQLDAITSDVVVWVPYVGVEVYHMPVTLFSGTIKYGDVVEPYMPGRVLRQFGFLQRIPVPPLWPIECYRPDNAKRYNVVHYFNREHFTAWYEHRVHVDRQAHESGCIHQDYMQWFTNRTHIRVQNPRYVPQDPQTSLTICDCRASTAMIQLNSLFQSLYVTIRNKASMADIFKLNENMIDVYFTHFPRDEGNDSRDDDQSAGNVSSSHRVDRRRIR